MARNHMTGKSKNRLAKWPYIFLAPFVLSFFAFTIYPIFYSLYVSLTNWTAINVAERRFVGLQNYQRVIQDPLFWMALRNTVRLMVMAIPATAICGLLMAVLMSSIKKGRPFFQTINFLPYIITPVAVGFMFSYLFDANIGPVNSLLSFLGLTTKNINWLGSRQYASWVVAFMMVWKNFGYFMILYLSGLSTIPDELYEAAHVDGANFFQSFFKITLPLLKPITIFVIINSCINGFQLFDEPVQVFLGAGNRAVGGPERSVLTVIWYFYDVAFLNHSQYGYGSAVAFSLFVIIALISLTNVKILNRKEG